MVFILALSTAGLMALCFWTVGRGQRLSLGRVGVFLFLTSMSTAIFYGAYRLGGEALALGALAKMMGEANYAFLILFVRSQRKQLAHTDEVRGMLAVAMVSVVHLSLNLTLSGLWQLSVMTAQVLVLIGWLALEAWWWWRAKPDGLRCLLLALVLVHWLAELVGRSLLLSQFAMGAANLTEHGWSDIRDDWMWVTFFLGFMTQMAVAGVVAQALGEAKARMEILVISLENQLEEKSSMMMKLLASKAVRETELPLASVAHELSQPLGAIRLSAEHLAQSGRLSSEEEYQVLQEILRQNHRATSIVQGLRNLFIDQTPPQTRWSVVEWLNAWAASQAQRCRDGGVQFVYDMKAPSGLEVMACQVQMEMVLQNLVKNAVEALANRSDGEIVLTLSVQGRWVQIEVADNGSGIAPALQDQIFEMNFTTKSHGMGIGLWLSRRIAKTHGGDLACVSSPRGARMRLTLPRV